MQKFVSIKYTKKEEPQHAAPMKIISSYGPQSVLSWEGAAQLGSSGDPSQESPGVS